MFANCSSTFVAVRRYLDVRDAVGYDVAAHLAHIPTTPWLGSVGPPSSGKERSRCSRRPTRSSRADPICGAEPC